MSDEESFVILGSSPMPSMTSMQQQPESGTPISNCSSFRSLRHSTNGLTTSVVDVKKQEVGPPQAVVVAEASDSCSAQSMQNGTDVSSANGNANGNASNSRAINSNTSSGQSSIGLANDSLAASFILGEVNADVLKTSVYSQFPSLCSMEACAEDVLKLQNFMSEYVELKNTLAKVNTTMKQFYNKTQQWKDDMQRMEANYQQQLHECQQQIAMLRNENLELKRDINTEMDHIKISDELRKKEHDELLQGLSEKAAIIENMRSQIIKLEQQQLASYEFVSKKVSHSKLNPEYIERLEHQRVVKGFERQLSEMVAKNLDLADVQTQYTDEINCLKVNLVAAEELIKNHQSEISLLKAGNLEKSHTFTNFRIERDEIKEELALLRQQVDVYSRDFEMERIARQNLAGEKDQLLQDLRSLQRKNQELIEEAQQSIDSNKKQTQVPPAGLAKASSPSLAKFGSSANIRPIRALPTSSSSGSEQYAAHRCPICSKIFKNLSILQSHVNDCLDKIN